jgi:hypothetical protein
MVFQEACPCFEYPRNGWTFVCSVIVMLAAAGCFKPPNRVTGLVTYEGQPLPAGRVTFLCEGTGRPAISTQISNAGRYEIMNPPLGRAAISVQTFKPRPKPPPTINPTTGTPITDEWEDTGRYVPIPERYRSPQTSGLETMIVPGPQTFDLILTR